MYPAKNRFFRCFLHRFAGCGRIPVLPEDRATVPPRSKRIP
jgi:hypothetical protein